MVSIKIEKIVYKTQREVNKILHLNQSIENIKSKLVHNTIIEINLPFAFLITLPFVAIKKLGRCFKLE